MSSKGKIEFRYNAHKDPNADLWERLAAFIGKAHLWIEADGPPVNPDDPEEVAAEQARDEASRLFYEKAVEYFPELFANSVKERSSRREVADLIVTRMPIDPARCRFCGNYKPCDCDAEYSEIRVERYE